jgi:hypothetical protein
MLKARMQKSCECMYLFAVPCIVLVVMRIYVIYTVSVWVGMVISRNIWASQAKPLMGSCLVSYLMWWVKRLSLLWERSKDGLIRCGAANTELLQYIWSNVCEETNFVLMYRASPIWMALEQIFLLFWIFAGSPATVPLKVLALQQLNSKNIRKMVVLPLHEPISGTSWFSTNVA